MYTIYFNEGSIRHTRQRDGLDNFIRRMQERGWKVDESSDRSIYWVTLPNQDLNTAIYILEYECEDSRGGMCDGLHRSHHHDFW